MKQVITIAKIGGEAANATTSLFLRWPVCQDSSATHVREASPGEASQFVDWLAQIANAPPVLFYCRYLDMWSMGDVLHSYLAPEDGNEAIFVSSGSTELAHYPLPDNNAMLNSMNKISSERTSPFDEHRWFAQILREAILSWERLVNTSVIVVVRNVVGVSVDEDEIKRSLSDTGRAGAPDWGERVDGK